MSRSEIVQSPDDDRNKPAVCKEGLDLKLETQHTKPRLQSSAPEMPDLKVEVETCKTSCATKQFLHMHIQAHWATVRIIVGAFFPEALAIVPLCRREDGEREAEPWPHDDVHVLTRLAAAYVSTALLRQPGPARPVDCTSPLRPMSAGIELILCAEAASSGVYLHFGPLVKGVKQRVWHPHTQTHWRGLQEDPSSSKTCIPHLHSCEDWYSHYHSRRL